MDKINMLTLTCSGLYKAVSLYKKDGNSQILDPLTCIIRLGTLSFQEKGTKVSIHQNNINFQSPSVLQGTIRWSLGDKSSDLHNLYNPIQLVIEWYKIDTDNDIKMIFEYAINGLIKLKEYYTKKKSISISHSLEHYINLLKSAVEGKETKTNQSKNDVLYTEFKKIWQESEIKLVYLLFHQATLIKDDLDENGLNPYIESINTILVYKDKLVKDIIDKTVSGN
jgi:hypothetical protein